MRGCRAQRWRLVNHCTIQHVQSGRFLHTEVKYANVTHLDAPWSGNHTHLVTRPQELKEGSGLPADTQRWTYGPEEFYGGKVLRHFKDGRAVDVHDWQVTNNGNNVGCENSAHGENKGTSFVFSVV